jgi:hypothetical protein
LRKVAATAFVVPMLISVVLVALLRPSSGSRNPVPRRPSSDLEAERLRLARRRAALEGRTELQVQRVPSSTPLARPAGPGAGEVKPLPRRRTRVVVPLGVAFLALLVASTAIVPFAEPEPITAQPPSTYSPIPVTGLTTPITVDREPDSAIVVVFSVPMDTADVASRLVVEPAAAVRLSWSDDASRLTIEAADGWKRGTYYTITIPAGALDATGAPLASAVRAAFLVRGLTAARISAPRSNEGLARLDTTIVVSFDRAVDLAAAAGLFSIEPSVAGSFEPTTGTGQQLVFTPLEPLGPGMTYTVTLEPGLVDEAGSPVQAPGPAAIRTVPRPRVLSTSPSANATDVSAATSISIRFSRPMDASSALGSFSATLGGRALGGSRTLTDDGALLTFRPAADLPPGATIAVQVGAAAVSTDGVDLGTPSTFEFRVRGSAIATSSTGSAPAAADPAGTSGGASTAEDQTTTAVQAGAATALLQQERKAKAAAEKKTAAAEKKAAAAEEKAAAAAKKAAAAKAKKEKAVAAKAAAEKKRAAAAAEKERKAKAAAEKAAAAKAKRAKAAEEKKAAKKASADAKAEARGKKKADGGAAKSSKPSNSAGGGTWAAVEAYYLQLINCARTGGVVSRSGTCSGGGTRNVKPLRLDAGISAKVSRPYARMLATSGRCSHFSGGGPSSRLRRAGFGSPRWAENLSCPSGMSPAATAVYSIRYFQREKAWNGGHWRNLRNPQYDRVGIGIWAARGRVIIVSNFYRG